MSGASSPHPIAHLPVSTLRQVASRIRDDLDPIVAKEGPNELKSDDVLNIHSVLLALQQYEPSLWTVRVSRIHLAVADICGVATRWPNRLVDEADRLIEHLTELHGSLSAIRTPLYGYGGRLHGICEPQDLTREVHFKYVPEVASANDVPKSLMSRFADQSKTSSGRLLAYKKCHLGFKAGQWWINGMFAFRDGIIDDKTTDGGICYDEEGAYAIVMTDSDEYNATSPDSFSYRCGLSDRGRYKLTTAHSRSRYPIRILRSHTLKSVWAPRVGLRYDGMYKVVGWTCRPVPSMDKDNPGIQLEYCVHFERHDKIAIQEVVKHPLAEEVDDYKEYKASCRRQRDRERRGAELLVARTQHTMGHARTHSAPLSDFDLDIMKHRIGSIIPLSREDSAGSKPASEWSRRFSTQDTVSPKGDVDLRLQEVSRQVARLVQIKQPQQSSDHPSRQRSTFDGSSDGVDGTVEDAESSDLAQPTRSASGVKALSWSNPFHPKLQGVRFRSIEWSPTLPRDDDSEKPAVGVVGPLIDVDDQNKAVLRGDFELARSKTPRPDTAEAFLKAQEGVWVDLVEAEYVDQTVLRRG